MPNIAKLYENDTIGNQKDFWIEMVCRTQRKTYENEHNFMHLNIIVQII